MKILSIETTDKAGSVAAMEGARLLAERRLNPDQRSAQSLAPAIQDLLQSAGWKPAEVGLVAVAVGPGSFTGLRVGVTTAKIFAYAVGAEVLGVNTLEVIAAQVPAGDAPAIGSRLSAVLDAQRQQVFVGEFLRGPQASWDLTGPISILDDDAWLAGLTAEATVTGPGLVKLLPRLPRTVRRTPEEFWRPAAGTVGRLAWDRFEAGLRDDLWQLVPLYFRKSAAEEKWEQSAK